MPSSVYNLKQIGKLDRPPEDPVPEDMEAIIWPFAIGALLVGGVFIAGLLATE